MLLPVVLTLVCELYEMKTQFQHQTHLVGAESCPVAKVGVIL